MRKIEEVAINEFGIPSLLLMENAAAGIAKHCLNALEGKSRPSVAILCGTGNNGGDGFALARLLHGQNIETTVILAGPANALKGGPARDAALYMGIVKKLGVPILEFSQAGEEATRACIAQSDLAVDALLGTGLDRDVRGDFLRLIEIINKYAKLVISVDIPSGVNSENGRVMGCAVKAALTVTLGCAKTGLYAYPGAAYAGAVRIDGITLPPALLSAAGGSDGGGAVITDSDARLMLPPRPSRANKGSFGKVLLLAGSDEMPGAAALSASAAYAAGGGLVVACVLPRVASVINCTQREVITRLTGGEGGEFCKGDMAAVEKEMNGADVILAGPGIGRGAGAAGFVSALVAVCQSRQVPLVLDADALFALAGSPDVLRGVKAPCVVTPHPGEMGRLAGLSIKEILDCPLEVALGFSRKYNVVTLLKDAHTVIAGPGGGFFINTSGNNALSKAGTGDVLAGLVAGFIAQGMDVLDASALGAYIHGKAGEAAALERSRYGVNAGDLLEYAPRVLRALDS